MSPDVMTVGGAGQGNLATDGERFSGCARRACSPTDEEIDDRLLAVVSRIEASLLVGLLGAPAFGK